MLAPHYARKVATAQPVARAADLEAVLGESKDLVKANDVQGAILAILKWKPRFTVDYFAERYGLTETEVTQAAEALVAAGKILKK